MAYHEQLANRIREHLIDVKIVEERMMFGGLAFLIDEKLCICVGEDEILVRLNPEDNDEYAEQSGVTQMINAKRPMKGYFYISIDELKNEKALLFWINKALEFNPIAKKSKKK